MSRWHGPAGRGAMRTLRETKRVEAETRQASSQERDAARRRDSALRLRAYLATPEGRQARRRWRQWKAHLAAVVAGGGPP